MKGLFLDDERNPSDVTWLRYPPNVEWTVVRTPEDFAEESKGKFDIYSFDHDIACYRDNKEVNGLTILTAFLVQSYPFDELPNCVFHTKNPVGRDRMETFYLNFEQAMRRVE